MKLRTVAPAATVALAALALLAGCKKGDSNANGANSNSKNVTITSQANTNIAPSPLGTPTSTAIASSPTEAFRLYYEAIKRGDAPAFRSFLSRGAMARIEDGAKKSNKSVDDFISEVLTAIGRDVPPNLPETRNERVNGDRATLEAHNAKRNNWETLHFVNEGGWKIAPDADDSGPGAGGAGGDDSSGGGDDGGDEDGGGDHDGGH
ncbi:MAG TPA: hypothetical protein VN256_15775 [Pyrinomonadaceae bacterium]|nr:hypothetical protein [Pyrinomonadaceae bacterium]